ncbi:Peptide synthetase [Acidisarcina polymorpha]|uniref:Peptide synthetase n=1 Tax=Acidisarcina polymorpha TaxID=2211140 RepID=A0A2Z5G7K3_9BACT|nr:non-ribosomal peptide synthetase [Acidisarcina polymorpha]AXC15242.1 Peptide synthetase [Acidisarcina polymorpha]
MKVDLLSPGSSLLEVKNHSNVHNGDARHLLSASLIADRIALQASVAPDAPAVVSPEGAVSYAQLDARAKAVAVRLRSLGVQPGQPVAIYFESSIDLIVAALGIWKAGGAYLPIDPAYPADRAAFILLDSGSPVLITRRKLAPALGNGPWITLPIEDISLVEEEPVESLSALSADDLAYVIYTSGSTGQPKGVEITHGNLLNLVDWHNGEFSITKGDRATQIAGPGFDAAVWEMWPYLAQGASIHLPPREARLSAALLVEWLVASKITVSFVPTVLAEVMLQLEWPASTSLRFLLTGGDALHIYPPANLPFVLVNNYGPTECTVVATSTPIEPKTIELETVDSAVEHKAPAIGNAILNTTLYMLDEFGKEVADGQAGELYIGGPSVGRGYRNRPDLTAASFVNVNVGGRTERLFRTGDLVKRLPDGQLAFVGRADDQIKIRGFRVEPDEIAFAINRHPAVASSAVIARSESGTKRLVAYVVAIDGAELWDHDLRDMLTKNLPDYMVPSTFVQLERIPVTANGKLNKAALPTPTDKNQVRRDNYVAPRSELEEIVEGILRPILGLERISIHDNFFLLGGHSLMGAQVIAKVRDIFDVELNLRNVFECPTVAKLAAKIEAILTARLEAMSEEEVSQALRSPAAADILTGSSNTQAG